MVLSTAAIVLAIFATIFATIFAAIFAPVFTAILTPVFSAVLAAIFTTRRLVGLTRYRGSGQQRAGDETCTEQL